MDVHGDRSILTWNSNSDDLVVAFDGSLSRSVEDRGSSKMTRAIKFQSGKYSVLRYIRLVFGERAEEQFLKKEKKERKKKREKRGK